MEVAANAKKLQVEPCSKQIQPAKSGSIEV